MDNAPSLAQEVRLWIESAVGVFFTQDIYKDLGITSPRIKKNVATTLSRLAQDGLIVKCQDRAGKYLATNKTITVMDWEDAPDETMPVVWPLGLEQKANVYPENIIIVAGEKNSSKTAFLMNVAYLNRDAFKVMYFNSEMGAQELKVRINKFREHMGTPVEEWKKIMFIERMDNFEQVMDADALTIIDYLHRFEEPYLIGQDLHKIDEKLKGKRGIAVIAMQRHPNSEWAVGGRPTIDIARLYLNLYDRDKGDEFGNFNKLKIKICKNWKGDENPNGMVIDFSLYHACQFTGMSDWYWPKEDKYTNKKT